MACETDLVIPASVWKKAPMTKVATYDTRKYKKNWPGVLPSPAMK